MGTGRALAHPTIAMQRTFHYQHHTRGIARVMIFVWMFALMTSLANACVLSGGAHAASFGHLHAAGHHSDAGITGAGSDHDHDSGPAKAACKGFCDLEQGTSLKSHVPAGLEAGAAPLLHSGLWSTPSPRAIPRVSLAAYRELPPGPPVAIRFPRLTI